MILGIGTDIIELDRVRNALNNKGFKQKVYSEREIEYCEKDPKGERFAARYAAKEAFLKALGTGWIGKMELFTIETLNDDSGKPYIALSGNTLDVFNQKEGGKIHVSLSHNKENAIAFVIIEHK